MNHCTLILVMVSKYRDQNSVVRSNFRGLKYGFVNTRRGWRLLTKRVFTFYPPIPPCVCRGNLDRVKNERGAGELYYRATFKFNNRHPVRVTQTIPLVGLQSYASNTRVSRCQCPTFRRLSLGIFLRRVRSVGHNGRTC